ncbi:uncharacterized protein LOC117146124 [Drosophila mauritiana]|uniref:Uncharacterized protein LOC117146124 n=1 Tax=Drosophila mauritiana TaxID=7226 RepID=A0A6P8KVP1_DROMA|nr:uncharacterized protein LOC117146124 [Drosophila mauritiana]
MDLDILNQHSSSFPRIAIWATWSLLLLSYQGCQAIPGGSSGERVHIRLHMPEVVRQHTHFHNVYKIPRKVHPVPAPPPTTIASMHPNFVGKPHVQLLGYTTAVGNSGPMASNIMQLMGTATTPTMMATPTNLMPNYGPALFDNYNQESALSATTTTTTMRPQILKASKQQQLLQQIFTPQINEDEDTSAEDNQLESNSLLNNNFLEALQREYFAKFGGRRKRKKSSSKLRNPNKEYSNSYRNKPYYYQDEDLSENFEDYQDEQPHHEDYEEVMVMSGPPKYGRYYPSESEETDQDHAHGYDSAVAFSGQDNSISSSMPTMEEFLHDANNPASGYGVGGNFEPYSNSNDMYSQPWQPSSTSATMSNSWSRPTANSYTNSSKGPKSRPVRSRGRTKVRYVKLITRKKRKSHIRTKRYRP